MIKFLVMDVDGTLTDGKIYMGVDGECMKAFDIKDGYALHTLLKENGIIPVIITARKSPMVEHRCKELGVTEIHQGVMNKLDCLKSIIDEHSSPNTLYNFSNVAYIGDDLLDLQCMNPIKQAGGIAGCPSNAAKEVIAVCDYVSDYKGGEGAVRDFVEYLIGKKEKSGCKSDDLKKRVNDALEYISKLDFQSLKVGRYEVNSAFFYTVQEYLAFGDSEAQYESHRKFIDIQWIYEGTERLLITDISSLTPSDKYDDDKDVIHYVDDNNKSAMVLCPGSCAILFPKDAHKPARFLNKNCIVKKVVGKVLI